MLPLLRDFWSQFDLNNATILAPCWNLLKITRGAPCCTVKEDGIPFALTCKRYHQASTLETHSFPNVTHNDITLVVEPESRLTWCLFLTLPADQQQTSVLIMVLFSGFQQMRETSQCLGRTGDSDYPPFQREEEVAIMSLSALAFWGHGE